MFTSFARKARSVLWQKISRKLRPCHTKGRPRAWITSCRDFVEAVKLCNGGCDTLLYAQWSVDGCKALRDSLAKKSSGVGSVSFGNTRVLAALSGLQKPHIRVLDLGGGAGFHYFIAKAALSPTISWEWRVIETPALVNAAKILANDELQFFDDLEKALERWDGLDLVFASGVMQCLPDAIGALQRLASLRPQVLCLTRTAVSPDLTKHVLIQEASPSARSNATPHGTRVCYPVILLPRRDYEKVLNEHFDMVLRLVEEPNVYRIAKRHSHMVGYICRGPRA